MNKYLLLISFGLIAAGTLLINLGFQQRGIEISIRKGELSPFKIDTSKPFTVWIGSNSATYSFNDLRNGIDFNRAIHIEGVNYPIQINFRGNNLLVSALIKTADNQTIAKMTDNQWAVSSDNLIAFDRNYNAYAVEVIDSNQIPVLQVYEMGQNEIYIGFSAFTLKSWVLVTPKGLFLNPSNNVTALISPIFRYPSEKHIGEMINSNPVIDWFQLESTHTIIVGVVIGIIGSFIGAPEIINRNVKKTKRTKRKTT